MIADKPTCMLCGSGDTESCPPKYMHGSLWRCTDCGLRFVHPQPSTEALEAVYDSGYFSSSNSNEQGYTNYGADRSNILRTSRHRLKSLQRLRPEKGKILDVGCAYGFFLEAADEAGWDAYGIDISRHAVERAEERLGDRVRVGAFLEEELPAEHYDMITMWDYLEHTLDARVELAKARQLLVDGGILALACPDVGSLPARLFGHRWMGYKVDEHLVYFSRSTLRRLLEELGFRVISMKYEGKYISLSLFLDRLCLYAPFVTPVVKLLSRVWQPSVSFYTNPRDIMLVLAQKSKNGAT